MCSICVRVYTYTYIHEPHRKVKVQELNHTIATAKVYTRLYNNKKQAPRGQRHSYLGIQVQKYRVGKERFYKEAIRVQLVQSIREL